MNLAFSTLPFDVLAAHGTAWSLGLADQFCRGVSSVVKRVEYSIQTMHPGVCLRPRCVSSEEALGLADRVTTCAVAIIDVSRFDLELARFVGLLQGADVPYIMVCQVDSEEAAHKMGLRPPNLLTYESMDEVFQADSALQQELLRAVPNTRIHEEFIYKFWFPRETSTIWVVCPQIHQPGEFADRSNPDYTYLDNLGDTDALLEVMVFLSQYYPNATIERFSSEDLPEGHTSSNLVVIGGPGSAEISNEICREMMSAMSSHVAYSSDCEEMRVSRTSGETIDLRAEYVENGERPHRQSPRGLRTDWGYYARFKNPLNENATVIVMNGIHTAGVLGAARAFSERREALRNFHVAQSSNVQTTSFECYFEVMVLNGQIKVPVVNSHNIFTLGRAEQAATDALKAAPSVLQIAERRPSMRILFIAGDRGGSQVNQLQIPREYNAIQDSLHACKHRDVIALANPILGATRERLALAYRERPTVVHFAGHGDARSLSIIEDQKVLASQTPMDASQFCDILRTMQERVRLCVLNVCTSANLAHQLVNTDAVDFAVGWSAKVSDSAAIAFSSALYAALGDGRGISDAVSVARVASGGGTEPVLVAAGHSSTDVLIFDGKDKE